MQLFRRFPSRPWLLGSLAAIVLLFGVLMLHPYPRQSLFGPKIEGVPWYVWENQVRKQAHAAEPRGWYSNLLEKTGVLPDDGPGLNLDSRAALPIWMHLADDADEKVRQAAILALCDRLKGHEAKILPILQRHFDDTAPFCRLCSAQAVWSATKDPKAISAILSLKNNADATTRRNVFTVLFEIAATEPSLFEPMAASCEDPNPEIRKWALRSMTHFGTRGLPILRKALRSSDSGNRVSAMAVALELGPDGVALRPELLALMNDSDPAIRELASLIVQRIDAKEFMERAN